MFHLFRILAAISLQRFVLGSFLAWYHLGLCVPAEPGKLRVQLQALSQSLGTEPRLLACLCVHSMAGAPVKSQPAVGQVFFKMFSKMFSKYFSKSLFTLKLVAVDELEWKKLDCHQEHEPIVLSVLFWM